MRTTALTVLLLFASQLLAAGPFPKFKAVTIDPNIGKVCYAVTVADVNNDGKKDIVAVSENRVLWYENPSWKPHVIIADQTPRDNVCIAPMDIDGDGKVDFALGAGWTKIGTIHWLRRNKSLKDKWQVRMIAKERWLHRMRWADVLGKGKKQLVISPLNKTAGEGVRLTAFEIPKDPTKDRWPSTVLDASLNRMHNHWHRKRSKFAPALTLTASVEGVHLIIKRPTGFFKFKIPGSQAAGEIKFGKIDKKQHYFATVEPMHGTALVVYGVGNNQIAKPPRYVIDKGFRRGHALWTADFDGDGDDDIAFGHSDTPKTHGVIVYEAQSLGKWKKHVIDAGGIATEDLIVADFNGDGRPDIVAGGRKTHNVKLYLNMRK